MSQRSKGGGRCRPPKPSLVGASEAASILGCVRSQIWRRYVKRGLLRVAVENQQGKWFERAHVSALAQKEREDREVLERRLRNMKRFLRKRDRVVAKKAPSTPPATDSEVYRPELLARRPPLDESVEPRPIKRFESPSNGVLPRGENREKAPPPTSVSPPPRKRVAEDIAWDVRWMDPDFDPTK